MGRDSARISDCCGTARQDDVDEAGHIGHVHHAVAIVVGSVKVERVGVLAQYVTYLAGDVAHIDISVVVHIALHIGLLEPEGTPLQGLAIGCGGSLEHDACLVDACPHTVAQGRHCGGMCLDQAQACHASHSPGADVVDQVRNFNRRHTVDIVVGIVAYACHALAHSMRAIEARAGKGQGLDPGHAGGHGDCSELVVAVESPFTHCSDPLTQLGAGNLCAGKGIGPDRGQTAALREVDTAYGGIGESLVADTLQFSQACQVDILERRAAAEGALAY